MYDRIEDGSFELLILGVLFLIDDDSSISAERVSLDPGITN